VVVTVIVTAIVIDVRYECSECDGIVFLQHNHTENDDSDDDNDDKDKGSKGNNNKKKKENGSDDHKLEKCNKCGVPITVKRKKTLLKLETSVIELLGADIDEDADWAEIKDELMQHCTLKVP
jgi:DNA-directed RNA polymerase subunit RPC12/RpoP